jgi:hypothetical protein
MIAKVNTSTARQERSARADAQAPLISNNNPARKPRSELVAMCAMNHL